jgi:hypothetical protein
MAVTDAQVADVVERLSRDLRSSGWASYLHVVQNEADNARDFVDDPNDYVDRVVGGVQECILDAVITWPACPHHPQHPLWYHDGAWFCDQERLLVAPLGALAPSERK